MNDADRNTTRRAPMGRRSFLRSVAGVVGAAVCGAQALPRPARAEGQFVRLQHAPGAPSVATLSPQTVRATERALAYYESLAARGGWPEVPADPRLRAGARHPALPALRERLMAEGDLDPRFAAGDVYDAEVSAAVMRFQLRHGMIADGMLREPVAAAMNVPAATRLAQLHLNLVRMRSMSGNLGPRHVVCNLPAAEIEAVENGHVVSRHTAVVGKPDRPSPDIQSRIVEVNFNPFWTVPASIVRLDLIPKMQAEPDYLVKNRIRIYDAGGRELSPAQVNWFSAEATNYRFRQDPGDLNSLGSIRINFPSAHGVYMHDTPYRNLFGEDFRFHSSGCVRVQDIRVLVAWLFATTPGWSPAEIDHTIRTGERRDARIAPAVPLYWVYVTGWVDAAGVAQFRDDIYGRDGLIQSSASHGRG